MGSEVDAASRSVVPLERYHFGAFTLDVAGRKLSRDGDELGLPSRAFDTLAHLVRHRDRIVEKDELIRTVWSGTFVSEDSLIHCVSVLRRVLQDEVEHPRFIATLPRRGYRFVGEVAEVVPVPARPAAISIDPAGPSPAPPPPVRETARRPRLPLLSMVALAAAALTLGFVGSSLLKGRSANTSNGPVVLGQAPPPGTTLASGGILSPGGHHLTFVARDQISGTSRIWVRAIDSIHVRPLAGTEDASKPFWSPDEQYIGYFARNQLKTVGLAGEPPRTLASLSVPAGGSWSASGAIVFADFPTGLHAVSAEGGAVTPLTKLDPEHDRAHAWPHMLPDGRHFLYTINSWTSERGGIWVGSIDGDHETHRVSAAASPAVYASTGFLLYVADQTLLAEAFDLAHLKVIGTPIPLVRNIPMPTLLDADVFSVTNTLLSFRGGTKEQRLVWFSRAGEKIGAVDGPAALFNPMLSPDGSQLVAAGSPTQDPGLWLIHLKGNASTRLSSEGIGPLWSPDGRHVAFTSRGGLDITISSTVGPPEEKLLLHDNERKTVQDWSPDGRFLVYTRVNPQTKLDLWLLPLSDPKRTVPLLATAANERGARISPDGRWVAYNSDESGRSEVYIQEFPKLGSKRAVSTGGGAGPSWRRDGAELFYLSPSRTLMAVGLDFSKGMAFRPPTALFRASLPGDFSDARNHYSAAPDGQSFLVNVIEETADHASITVMVNWSAALKTERTATTHRDRLPLLAVTSAN